MFPTLYSRTSTGKVQQWTIKVEGNQYWTESGQVDGKIVVSKPTVAKGKNIGKKNETTPEQQAIADAQSKFDKQLKTGYFTDINEIDNLVFKEPMLAKSYKDRKNVDLKLGLVQCKFNGGRCIARADGLWTRKGERILAVPHIEEALRPFFAENPTAILDGELFNEDYRQQLNKIMQLIRRTVNLTQEHFDESRKLIKFYVYDGYGMNNTTPETPYYQRKSFIDRIVKKTDYLEEVETHMISSEREMWSIYQMYVDQGHEGAILRFENSPYEHKRSANLLKLKPTDDAEFLILGFEEGEGNWSGCAKIVNAQMDDDTKFNATFKGTMEQARHVLSNKDKYIGKRYTLYYNGLTGYGIPNYAQFDYNNSVPESDK